MTPVRLAVIDLGSNTFHLLIAEMASDGTWNALYKDRRYVKLASGGIRFLDEISVSRAQQVMMEFASILHRWEVAEVKAIGTAALRESENGAAVAALLAAESGIPIEIIPGGHEAMYIWRGIQSALPPLSKPCLIMDIGGGSVEFILYRQDEILFKQSFTIGVAVLHKTFHHSDPMSAEDIRSAEQHLETVLQPVLKAVISHGPYYLIGASGSFEVIYDVMSKAEEGPHWARLHTEGLEEYLNRVISASLEERKRMGEIPEERLDYIVVAYLLIRWLWVKTAPERLYYVDFALKEGVLDEMIQNFRRI